MKPFESVHPECILRRSSINLSVQLTYILYRCYIKNILGYDCANFSVWIYLLPVYKLKFSFVLPLWGVWNEHRAAGTVCLRRQYVGGLRNAASLHTCRALTLTSAPSAAPATSAQTLQWRREEWDTCWAKQVRSLFSFTANGRLGKNTCSIRLERG